MRGDEGRTGEPSGCDGYGQYRHQPAPEGVSRFDPCLIQRDPGEEHPEQDGRRGSELEQGVDAGTCPTGNSSGMEPLSAGLNSVELRPMQKVMASIQFQSSVTMPHAPPA